MKSQHSEQQSYDDDFSQNEDELNNFYGECQQDNSHISERSFEEGGSSLMDDLKIAYPEENMRASLANLPSDCLYDCNQSVTCSAYSLAPSLLSVISNQQQQNQQIIYNNQIKSNRDEQAPFSFNNKGMTINKKHQKEEDSFMAEGGANINTLPPAAEVESNKPAPKERVYYADWIRAIAITLVIFVHCLVNSFDASGLDPEEVPTIQQKKDGIIKSLVQIGIPMFFYISGIGSTFFKTEEKNFGIFVGDKVLRLLIPFIVAIFVFLIPRLYFGQQYEDFTRPDDQIESNYWEYMKKMLPGIHLKLSWLWYLPALFIDCILTYPLLRWSIRRSKRIPFDPLVDTGIVLHQIITLALWCLPNYYLVTKDSYGERYLVPSIFTLGAIMFCFYTFQLAIPTKNGHHYAMWIKLIGPCGSIALNYWKVQTSKQDLYHIFLMINYDAVFFSQGVVDMCYWKDMLKKRSQLADTALAPCAVVFFLLMYSITSPMVYSDMGHLFFYPLYKAYSLQCLYTTGTWIWLYFTIWMMAKVGNDKFNDTAYNLICGASLYAYVSHYFFILILSVGVIRPYKLGFMPAFFIMFFGTEFIIFATYIPLNFLYELIVPPKQTKKMDVDSVVDKSDIKAMEDAQLKEQEALAAAKAERIEKGDAALDLENDFSDKKSGANENEQDSNNRE